MTATTTIVVDEQCNGTLKEVVSCSFVSCVLHFLQICLGFDSSSSGPWAVI
jgi:hypothetical protein